MVADGLAKGGVDMSLLHSIAQECKHEVEHEVVSRSKVSAQ